MEFCEDIAGGEGVTRTELLEVTTMLVLSGSLDKTFE